MKFNNFFKKQFYLIAIPIVLLPMVMIIFLLIMPAQEEAVKLKIEQGQLKNNRDKKDGDWRDLSQSLNLINALPAHDVAKLEEILPVYEDFEGLIQILSDKAAASGLILKTVDITPAASNEKVVPGTKILKIAANFANGDYYSFKNLISALESNARIFDIRSVSFTANSGNYAVNLQTYWLDSSKGTSLKIDNSVFDNPVFKMLQPARRELRAEPKGDGMPFKS